MKDITLIVACIIMQFTFACEEVKEKNPIQKEMIKLNQKIEDLKQEAQTLEDENGWLVSNSCDAILWSSKYCYASPERVNLLVAESDTEQGRFYRTAAKDCWVKGRDTQNSGSTWSRDMGITMMSCAYNQKNLDLLERHITYGERTAIDFITMGEGDKTRLYYSPALVGLLYKTVRILGNDHKEFEVPNTYKSGLDDYEAHLQMLDIWHRGRLDGKINELMLKRIKEHSNREPKNTFYQILRAKYDTGDYAKAIELCLDDSNVVGSYVRCDGEQCELAERLFSCSMIANDINM